MEMENNRLNLKKDDLQRLNDFVEKKLAEKYTKFYNGKVIDNKDPEKLGRCRIRVFGVYGSDIPNEDIPWAVPDFTFVGSTVGSFVVPPPDALVKVYFDQNNVYAPKYTTKVLDKNKLSTERDEDYPDTMVFFETDEGEFFKINRKTFTTTYHTASGINFIIDKDGNVDINTEGTNSGDITITTKDNNKLELLNDVNGGDFGVKITDRFGNKFFMGSDGILLEDVSSKFELKDANGNIITLDSSGIKLETGSGAGSCTFEITSAGLKINGLTLVTEKFLDWIVSHIADFGLGNFAAPVPINPATAAPELIVGTSPGGDFKTQKPGV